MTLPSDNRYLALPPAGKGPGVLVLHAWWGLNDFIRGFCDRLAQAGFTALAPDMFAGKVARTPEEAKRLASGSNEEDNVPPIILSALDELRRHPAVTRSGVGVIGFSFGGYWALWLSAEQPETVRAVTIFYSTGEADFRLAQAAFLGHYAEDDPFEPLEGVRELEQSIKDAGRLVTFHTYPGTGHWFVESDRPDAYDPATADLAWDRTVAFLREQLEARPS